MTNVNTTHYEAPLTQALWMAEDANKMECFSLYSKDVKIMCSVENEYVYILCLIPRIQCIWHRCEILFLLLHRDGRHKMYGVLICHIS